MKLNETDRQIKFEAKLDVIIRVDPKELIPHPVSIALYGEIDAMEIIGWRSDKSPFLNENTSVTQRMDVTDLIKSIEGVGILNQLVINEEGVIISGCRRWIVALLLGLHTVPVEVRSYANELEEKEAILHYNKTRKKKYSQIMREAELEKEIVGKIAKARMLTGKRDPTLNFGEGYDVKRHNRETAAIVSKRVGIGKDEYLKGNKIFQEAKNGNQKAAELVEPLDNNEISVNRAYLILTKNDNNQDNPELDKLQMAESIEPDEFLICPHCFNSVLLKQCSNGNDRYKLVKCECNS